MQTTFFVHKKFFYSYAQYKFMFISFNSCQIEEKSEIIHRFCGHTSCLHARIRFLKSLLYKNCKKKVMKRTKKFRKECIKVESAHAVNLLYHVVNYNLCKFWCKWSPSGNLGNMHWYNHDN